MNKVAQNGYLYIAYGKAFTKEALLSIESLRRFTQIPIALYTDQEPDSFDENQKKFGDVLGGIASILTLHPDDVVNVLELSLSLGDITLYMDSSTSFANFLSLF